MTYKERRRKISAKYREANREKLRRWAREYYYGNKSTINEKHRKRKVNLKTKEGARIRKIKDRAELKALRHVLNELGIYKSIKKEIDRAVKI